MSEFTVVARPVRPGDHDGWVALFRGYREFSGLAPDDDVVARVWSWILDPEHETRALVAVSPDQESLGLTHFRRFARPSTGTTGRYLDDLFARPARRGSGIGRALIAAVVDVGVAEGCSVVRWITAAANQDAQRLYDAVATRTSWVTHDIPCAGSTAG